MANLIDIRRRIRSVKNTQQITKAMKMVASARLRRSQDRILAARPYALELRTIVGKLAARIAARGAGRKAERHPLLESRPENRVLLVVVTGDKGLAGAFNGNVLRQARQAAGEWPEVELLLLGKKGVDFFRRRGPKVRQGYSTLFAGVTYEQAAEIAEDVAGAFARGEYDAVYVIYNEFRSIMQQKLTQERLLPIATPAEDAAGAESGAATTGVDYIYEPSAEAILAELLPRYVTFQFYRVLLESQAAENAARMTAMDSATKNAERDDRPADADLQPGAPGGDHQGAHRGRLRRGGARLGGRIL